MTTPKMCMTYVNNDENKPCTKDVRSVGVMKQPTTEYSSSCHPLVSPPSGSGGMVVLEERWSFIRGAI